MSQSNNETFLTAIDRFVSNSKPLSILLDKIAGRLAPQASVRAAGGAVLCYYYCGNNPCGLGKVHNDYYSVWRSGSGPCEYVYYEGCTC
jgi:hypothetical protein